jgi:hypothetical protein
MTMIRCSKGHFFNDQEHALCPWCGSPPAEKTPAGAIDESLGAAGKIGGAYDQPPDPEQIGENRRPLPEPEAYPPFAAPQPPDGYENAAEDYSPTRDWGSAESNGEAPAKDIPPAEEADEGHTVARVRKKTGMDPLVGWLVCVEGVEKGRDYRLRSEKNWIGRSDNMDVTVKDPAVSRENHAAVVYDPRKGTFDIRPGEVRGIVYVNGEEVVNSLALSPYDKIELGGSKFLFIPFVGDNFNWEENPDGEEK